MLLFYPLDWTFVCPTEIVEFSDKIDEFQVQISIYVVNKEIIYISPGSKV